MKKVLITGGAGFIGSHFVELCLRQGCQVLVLDLLTYAGNHANLAHLTGPFDLMVGDIGDAERVRQLLEDFRPDAVFNFAAESHVDRSIAGPAAFLHTNIMGTYVLLEEALKYWRMRPELRDFRFVQISTDEVFGALGAEGFFTEQSPYQPNSPYSASKAAADHLVRAWHHTYGLPTLTTHCSNNYGPRQYPEKLIPFMIKSALAGKPLGVYGNGSNVRDWIHVKDHCLGLWQAYKKGEAGANYCFSGHAERTNLDVVKSLCACLDEIAPRAGGGSYSSLITFVTDRLGHDWRYAIDDSCARQKLDFKRRHLNFADGLRDTVRWYVGERSPQLEVEL